MNLFNLLVDLVRLVLLVAIALPVVIPAMEPKKHSKNGSQLFGHFGAFMSILKVLVGHVDLCAANTFSHGNF